ncbi:hypothetical protein H5410_003167, partial [Solanum commersonii]
KATQTEKENTIEDILKAITTHCIKVDSMDNEIQKLKTNEDNLKSKASTSQQHDYKNAELSRSEDFKNPELRGDVGKHLKTHNDCLNIVAGTRRPEKIEEIRSQRPESILEVSPNDALGILFGPKHLGHVRGLGLGVVPTMAFKQTSRRFMHVNVSSSSSSNPTPKWQQEMTSMKSQLNVLLSLYQRNIGNIPEEFAHLFPPSPQ